MNKSDLLQFRAAVLELRRLKVQLEVLKRDRFSVPGPNYSGMPGGTPSGGSAVEAKVIKYQDALALYQEKVAAKEARLVAIEQAVEALPAAERLVLRLRYIEGRSWTSVCVALQPLGYSERQVYRLHGSALERLKGV